jgi:PAS domain S-box-containing protein
MKPSPEPLDEPIRALADRAPVPLWAARLDKCCIYVNPCWLAFTGRSFEQELGDGWAGRVHPNDRDRCLATYQGAFEARQEFRVNFRLQRGDGAYRQVAELGLPRVDARGAFRGYFGLCLDVTEREQAEQALEHSIVLDYLGLEALPGSVVVVARGGQILAANPAWVKFCQEHEAPLGAINIGSDYREVCRWATQGSEGLLPLALQGVGAVLNGQRERFTLGFPAPSGAQRWFELVVYPVRSPVRGAILAHLEVTQRHWAEALARFLAQAKLPEALAALGDLLSCTNPPGEAPEREAGRGPWAPD